MCVLIQFTLPFSEKFSVINTKICSLSVEDIEVFLVVLYERSNKLQPIEFVAIVSKRISLNMFMLPSTINVCDDGRPRITWLSTVQQHLKQHHFTLPRAADLAQNHPLWRMMSIWCHAILELHARNDDNDDDDKCFVLWYFL